MYSEAAEKKRERERTLAMVHFVKDAERCNFSARQEGCYIDALFDEGNARGS